MAVFGVTMVRDEEAVIGQVIEHLFAEGVDHVIVADNLSTDRTREILDGLASRLPVTVVDDTEPAYLQAEKINRLAGMAVGMGAEWIVPFDADELWTSPGGQLGAVLRSSVDADVLCGEWFNHLAPIVRRGPFGAWRLRRPEIQGKVAYRPLPGVRVRQGNHDVDGGPDLRRVHGRLVVHHFPYRSFGHFVRKNRAGKRAMDAAGDRVPQEFSAAWRRYGDKGRLRLAVSWLMIYVRAVRAGVTVDRVRPQPGPSR